MCTSLGCPCVGPPFTVLHTCAFRAAARTVPDPCPPAATAEDDDSADAVARVFHEFRRISCLKLNIPKTVAVPIWQIKDHEVRELLIAEAPEWGESRLPTS